MNDSHFERNSGNGGRDYMRFDFLKIAFDVEIF